MLLDRDDVAQKTFEVFPEGVDYVLKLTSLDQIVEAHRYMEENRATGKVVGVP